MTDPSTAEQQRDAAIAQVVDFWRQAGPARWFSKDGVALSTIDDWVGTFLIVVLAFGLNDFLAEIDAPGFIRNTVESAHNNNPSLQLQETLEIWRLKVAPVTEGYTWHVLMGRERKAVSIPPHIRILLESTPA